MHEVPFLTPEWCDLLNAEAEELPEVPGATATFEILVRRNAGITTPVTLRFLDGGVTCRMGAPIGADVRIELEEDDYKSLLVGELDLMKAYARGALRVTGALERLMLIAPLMDTPAYGDLNRRVHRRTAFE